jgi:hypothetical protein
MGGSAADYPPHALLIRPVFRRAAKVVVARRTMATQFQAAMSESDAYGRRLAERLHSETPRALVARGLRKGIIGFTEVLADNPTGEVSDPAQAEDGFLVALQLRDFPDHHYWEGDRQAPIFSLKGGCTTLYDLKRSPAFLMDEPFHSVHFYFPRIAFNAVADDANAPRIGGLRYEPGKGIEDPIMRALTSSLYPPLERPEYTRRMLSGTLRWRSDRMWLKLMSAWAISPRSPF